MLGVSPCQRLLNRAFLGLRCVPPTSVSAASLKLFRVTIGPWPGERLSTRRFSATHRFVLIDDLANYIHNEINGSVDGIHEKLAELVDILEYPNDGSITKVTLPDAKLMVEDIGACPQSLEAFLVEDASAQKSVAPWEERKDTIADPIEHLTTEDLIAKYESSALGVYVEHTTSGFKFSSYTGPPPRSMIARPAVLSGKHALKSIKKNPANRQLNEWCAEHESPPWQKCQGRFGQWCMVEEANIPEVTSEMRRQKCLGYCRFKPV